MKVKELIEKLSEFDPEVNVLHTVLDGFSEDDIYGVRSPSNLFPDVVIY